MSRYDDPLMTLAADLPVGWVHDPFSSTLLRLVFVHFARIHDSLSIALGPPQIPAGADDEAWRKFVATQVPPGTALTRVACTEGPALAADLHGKIHTRVAFIRGARLYVIVEHRCLTDDAATTALLPRVLATLEIPPNRVGAPAESRAEAGEWQQKAHAEFQSGVLGPALSSLRRALSIGRNHWLTSLVADERQPNLRDVAFIFSTLADTATITGELPPLRDADAIALRARRSLDIFLSSPEEIAAEDGRWRGLQEASSAAQARLLALQEIAPPLVLLLARGRHAATLGVDAGKRGDLRETAARGSEALTDFLLALAKHGQQVLIPRPAGASPPADDGIRKDTSLFALVAAEFVYNYAMDRQDARAARDAATLMTQLTDPGSEDAVTRRAHLRALLALAGALQFTGDAATLARADGLMQDATQILATLPDDPSLSAEVFRDHAWIKQNRRDMQAGAALCSQGLTALTRLTPPLSSQDERMRRALSSLHSQFLLYGNHLADAEAAARVAVDDVAQPISSNLLNYALVLDKAGRRPEALTQLRRAFEIALPDNPLGDDVLHVLFVASVFMESLDLKGSLRLHAAAEALLDAQRLQFGEDADRVAFDENSNHLEISQTLVGRLIDAGDLGGALAAADRSRARGLVELLGPPHVVESPPTFPAAPVLDSDPVQALLMAGDHVTGCAARLFEAYGGSAPLDVPGIMAAVQAAGRPALLIQPERGRVHLFCILPENAVIMASSPVPLQQIVAAMNAAQDALGVFAVARSRGQLVLADVDDVVPALDLALKTLSDALIAPLIERLIGTGVLQNVLGPRGLIIVPYRELALIPYALLSTPDGALLIEQAPLVQVPSLAALASLQRRAARVGPTCAVMGDPLPDPALHLEPLAAAAEEARLVAALLTEAGVQKAHIALRLDKDATAAQYRIDAADSWLVHLSCHAAVQDPASQSALYLTPSAITMGN